MKIEDQRFVISDKAGNFYRLDKIGQLVPVREQAEAEWFSYSEAMNKVGNGRKAQFYNVIPLDKIGVDNMENPGLVYDLQKMNWHEYLKHFLFVKSSVKEYEEELQQALSDVDQEICDLMHYVEMIEMTESKSLDVVDLLRDCRERRRQIKDNMYEIEWWKKAFGYNDISNRVRESISQINKLDARVYKPRKLVELFDGNKRVRKQISVKENRKMEEICAKDILESCNQEKSESIMIKEEMVVKTEGSQMKKEWKETCFDGKKNNWLEFAKEQLIFFGNVQQYMINLKLDIERLDREISDVLLEIENACYNVTQGYKAFKKVKDLRVERREKDNELYCLEVMTGCFDCIYMEDLYRYSVGAITEIMTPLQKDMKKYETVENTELVELPAEMGA